MLLRTLSCPCVAVNSTQHHNRSKMEAYRVPRRWKIRERTAQRSPLFARTKFMNFFKSIFGNSVFKFRNSRVCGFWSHVNLVRDMFVDLNENNDDRKIIDVKKNNTPVYGRRAKNCQCPFCIFISVGFCLQSSSLRTLKLLAGLLKQLFLLSC